jgi:hypothetical protein
MPWPRGRARSRPALTLARRRREHPVTSRVSRRLSCRPKHGWKASPSNAATVVVQSGSAVRAARQSLRCHSGGDDFRHCSLKVVPRSVVHSPNRTQLSCAFISDVKTSCKAANISAEANKRSSVRHPATCECHSRAQECFYWQRRCGKLVLIDPYAVKESEETHDSFCR